MNVILTTYQGAILGPIARVLGYILQALYALLANFGIENTGICMILFTFLVNGLMMPMQIKQQKFSKMSMIMNPEIQAIQKKYKNKKDQASQQKMSLETQAVYQKYGVSPASGCLPMLITFPILLALYRVIYNIPAYVPQVYDIYSEIAEQVKSAGISVEQLSKMVSSSTYVVTNAVSAAKKSDNISYFVDVLGQFNTSAWTQLAAKCPDLKTAIMEVADKSKHINTFLGLNIADTPGIKSVSIIIPILSVITQMLSTKISMAGTQQQDASDNPTAQSMKTMNNVMPFITGLMCFMFPIGVGIYWVAGNVFRIFQGIGINVYFSKIDMDAEMAKNAEKNKKRMEKMGIDPNSTMQDIAKQRTSSINNTKTQKTNKNSGINKNAKVVSTKESPNNGGNKNYKKGSIAAYANMLARDDNNTGKKIIAEFAFAFMETEENMSDWREFSAKTVDDAITNALVELQTTSDKIEYEVVEEGSSGILGLFSKQAVIRVRKKDDIQENAVEFLSDVFKAMEMNVDIEIEYNDVEKQMNIELSGDEMGMLIGKRGVTLDSLQYLVSLVINKKTEDYVKVKIDTENYRERRKETLENLARNLAHKVKRIHKSVVLEPMNPYERRVIHSTLQNDKYVETHSEGEEPYRKVVISLKPGFEKDYEKKKKYGYGNKSRYRNNGGYKKYNNSYRKNYNRDNQNAETVSVDEEKVTDSE